ncbi:sodium:proton antiporter [Anoxybacter fermentans]|nr:ArsB/NhaD family transporter [Anoxybacter fermentans]
MQFSIAEMTEASSIFLIIYGFIISEKVDRAVITLLGATIVVLFGPLSAADAINFVDFDTLSLLVSMMILVSITRKTGVFQYIAYKLVNWVEGSPVKILVLFSALTAVFSALLDNVTTVVMIAPITLVVSKALNVSPVPYLIAEILSSNIGGTATLIGDPPNIMIGSATGLSFMDFILNLGPVVLIIYIVTITIIYLLYRRQLEVSDEIREQIKNLNCEISLKNKELVYKSLSILGLTLIGFMFHDLLGIETAAVAIIGALLLMLISKVNADEAFREVEWATIFFFAGLFILVGALEKVGLLDLLARGILHATQGNLAVTSALTLWGAGLISGFLDNIPFVATAIPVIKGLSDNSQFLWWALSLGACLGGNMTVIGASANVIVTGMAQKEGIKISFMDYLKIGLPLTLLALLICQIYIYLRYLI